MKSVRSRPALLSVLVLVISASVVGVAAISAPSAQAVTAAQPWSNSIDIPGLASLGGPGQPTWLTQVACTSPGNCVAGGSYTVGSRVHPLFVDQVNGVWGNAYDVPGSWAFDGDDIERRVETLACAPDGGCVAAGTYATGRGMRVFVTQRVGGVWSDAQPVPNPSELAGAGDVGQYYLRGSSCSSTGNCSVVGIYFGGSNPTGGYIVDLVDGAWQGAIDVPGVSALTSGNGSYLTSIACPANGECSAVGSYESSTGTHAYVVDRSHGVWGAATEVPGLPTLATGGFAEALTISCSSVGNCSVGGNYSVTNDQTQPASVDVHAFVVDRNTGQWAYAEPVLLPESTASSVSVVSCPSDGNCSAIGRSRVPGDPTSGHDSLFTVQRIGGSWSSPAPLAGLATLNTADGAAVESISCAAPGICAATGHFTDSTREVPFVVNSSGWTWSAPIAVPGVQGPSIGDCSFNIYGNTCPTGRSVACPSIMLCVAVGVTYPAAQGRAFITEYHAPLEPEPPAPVTPVFTG